MMKTLVVVLHLRSPAQGYAWQHRATADDFSSLPEVPRVMQTDRERYLCSQGWGCSAYFGPVERR